MPRMTMHLIFALGMLGTAALANPVWAELNPGSSAPLWGLDLEFEVSAGLVQDDDFLFATLGEGELLLRAGTLERGRLSFPHGREPLSTLDLDVVADDATSVFALKNDWMLLDGANTLVRVDSDFSRVRESGNALLRVTVPMASVTQVLEANGVLYVTGGEPLTVAAVPMDELTNGGTNWTTMELCDCAGASIVVTHSGLRVIGGRLSAEADPTTRNRVRLVTLDADGLPESIDVEYVPMYRSIGGAVASQVHNMIGVLPENPPYRGTEAVERQTLIYAVDRLDGAVTPWREAEKEIPLLRSALLIPDEKAHHFYVAGGTVAETGEPNTGVWAIEMGRTDTIGVAAREQRQMLDLARRAIDRTSYQDALEKARQEERYHVLFLYDDSERGEEFFMAIHTSRDIRLMLEESVISRPANAEEHAALAARIGVQNEPVMVLMDHIGNVIGRHEGIPTREDVFRLMQPALSAPGF